MLHGIATLLIRSLRLDARQLRTHLFRLVFAVFIYFMMFIAQVQASMFGAPGLTFFSQIFWLNAIAISLGGVSFFSTAITEEKEEDTIGLLMMAGINPLGILLGKSTARLFQALILLTVQFPFTLLSITLGGVTIEQVVAAYAALLAFTIALANIGLLASVFCRSSGAAAGLTTLCLAAYIIVPPIAESSLASPWATGASSFWMQQFVEFVRWVAELSIFNRLIPILATGFNEPAISRQVISNLVLGGLCFLLSWLIFPAFALHADVQGVSRGMLTRSVFRFKATGTGRTWGNALVWKEFHFLTGGPPFLFLKLVAYALLYAGLIGMEWWNTTYNGANFNDQSIIQTHFAIVIGVLAIEAAIFASRLFHDEVRAQTLSSLMMLPVSIAYLGYSKVGGALLGLTASLLVLLADSFMLTGSLKDWLEVAFHPGLWFPLVMYSIFLHLVVLLSLFVRWGALPLAIFVMFLFTNCCPLMFIGMAFAGSGSDEALATLIALAIAGTMFAVTTFVFQMMIHARLYELGAK